MENLARAVIHGLFYERSTLGKVQVRFINLAIFLILLTATVLAFLKIDQRNLTPTIIVAGILLAYLFILASATESLLRRRAKIRQRLYRHWRYNFGLDAYSDSRIDSSVLIGIKWQWSHAEVVRTETHGDLQYNAIGRIRSICNDLQQNFKTKNPWLLSIEELRQGVILAWEVDASSFDYKLFRAQVTIYEIVKNVIDARGLPQMQFEGLSNVNGEVYFDHVILSGLEAQHFSEHTINFARQAFLDNFIEKPDHVWDVIARGDGTVAFIQVPTGSY